MWNEGDNIQRYDWQPGTLVIPPDRTFHQHFNIGATPARYLALRFRSTRLGGDQIEYEDQDPVIHRMFLDETAKHGVTVHMDQFLVATVR